MKNKDLLKKRRQLIKSEAEINHGETNAVIFEQPDFLAMPFTLPESSGDEYSGESAASDIISEGFLEELIPTPENDDNSSSHGS